MMSNATNERLKIYTQHVPLRQNTEEEVRGKDLEAVWATRTNETRNRYGRHRGTVQGYWNPYSRSFRHYRTDITLQISETRSSNEVKLVRFLRELINQIRCFTVSIQEKSKNNPVYYELLKRDLKTKPINEWNCFIYLLWIVKARAKDKKLYMDFGVMKG